MANKKINGKFGIYYHFDPDDGPDRPNGAEMVMYPKSSQNSPVYSDEGDSNITIAGRYLAEFVVELIRAAQELGVTEKEVADET